MKAGDLSRLAALVPGLFELGPDGPTARGSAPAAASAATSTRSPRASYAHGARREAWAPKLLGRRGILYSFTVCHVAPAGWRAPYLQAYVELPEESRVFTLVSHEVDPIADSLTVGQEMELIVEPVRPRSSS